MNWHYTILSRKYGVHTAVFNKTYVWTTLMNHVNVPDEEIIAKCGVNLVFLGPTKYGIIKSIRVPQLQPQNTRPPVANILKAKLPAGMEYKAGKLRMVEAPVGVQVEGLVPLDQEP